MEKVINQVLSIQSEDEKDFIKFDDSSDEENNRGENGNEENSLKSKKKSITPWVVKSDLITNSGLRLHYEIIEFVEFIKPKPKDIEIRKAIIRRIEDYIQVIIIFIIFGRWLTCL